MANKIKVALIKPPRTYADYNRVPALGIGYISACLKARGIDCKIFDAHFRSWSREQTVERVAEYHPDIIGFSAMTHEIVPAAEMASTLKKRLSVPTVVGGCHTTALPERTLREFPVFDYAIQGEGEKTMPELVEFLKKSGGTQASDLPGVVFKDAHGNIRVNKPREFLTAAELDNLPHPDFADYYSGPRALADKNSCYTIFSSRGCPFQCVFCMQVLGRKVRRRSANNVVQEMEYAITNYGVHTFDFSDEIFLYNDKETRELLQLMIDASLSRRIRWSALVRANFVTPELIGLAKRTGCFRLEMGVESGDEEVLKAIKKGITVEQVKRAVKIIKDAHISLGTYFILGHPGETRKTIWKTIRLAAKLNTDSVAIGIMVPYPGTMVYEMAKKGEGGYRLLSENWAEYDKYGGKALEVGKLSFRELSWWQRWGFLYFYLRNLRLLNLISFFVEYRHGIWFIIKKIVHPSGEKKG